MATQVEGQAIEYIPVERVEVHRLNPRKDPGDVRELAASIQQQGVLLPILVVRDNGGYAAVHGSRRLAATKAAGLSTIPAIVREDMTDDEITEIALVENLQREDLNPLEEAQGYRAWLELTKRTQNELAKAVGKAPSTIANALRVLEAAPPIQQALERGDITLAHAKVAMSIPAKALSLVALKKDVSVSELEEQAKVAQRSYTNLERIRAAKEKAEAAGKVVTWRDGEVWVGGADIDLSKVFGEPKKKLAGILAQGGYGHYEPTTAVHAQVCECEALAIVQDGRLVPACVSPTGWKKAQDKARAAQRSASPTKKKKAKTAEDRRKEAERDTKAAIKEADEALNMKKLRSYHPLKTNVAPQMLKGGLAGEPARLVLFGEVVQNSAGSNRSKTWEVELWKKIAKLPLKTVRDHVTKWAVAAALEEIRGTNRYHAYGTTGGLGANNATVIRGLVDAHYGVRKSAAKKAKR